MGGGIYIEVPLYAEGGIVEVAIRNAVRTPYFSLKPFHQTSLDEWRNAERNQPGPWTDFQTEKFLMQVPSSWIRKLEDPVTLMRNWDLAMDVQNDLMGLPRVWGKETMFLQVDLQLRASVCAPVYPTANGRNAPRKEYDGYANHYLVRGPQYAPDYVFHEQGHGFGFVKFGGEQESTVNLLHVAIQNQQFGQSLDEAFRDSRGFSRNPNGNLDNTAVSWMSTPNFLDRKPMDSAQKSYQLEGLEGRDEGESARQETRILQSEVVRKLYPEQGESPSEAAQRATYAILQLGSLARLEAAQHPYIPARMHLFVRTPAGVWVDPRPKADSSPAWPWGASSSQPRAGFEEHEPWLRLYHCRPAASPCCRHGNGPTPETSEGSWCSPRTRARAGTW